jgi:hypothetical protein
MAFMVERLQDVPRSVTHLLDMVQDVRLLPDLLVGGTWIQAHRLGSRHHVAEQGIADAVLRRYGVT